MTPQERQLIDDLFGRLERLETAPRDAEAESAIMAGLRRAPNAVYALVQTALLQDEALKHAAERIKQLEAGETPQNQGSFLDSLRGSLFGENTNTTASRGSVPNVPPSGRCGTAVRCLVRPMALSIRVAYRAGMPSRAMAHSKAAVRRFSARRLRRQPV